MNQEAVDFIINGCLLSFHADRDTCLKLLEDDEFSKDYIERAIIIGELRQYGIEGTNELNIFRPVEQPHVAAIADKENQLQNSVLCEDGEEIFVSRNSLISETDLDATKIFLEIRGSDKYLKLFNDKKSNKLKLWQEIATELNQMGFKISVDKIGATKCRQKFANLQKSYTSFITNSRQTGASAEKLPPFYNELHSILGSKDKITPKLIINSADTDIDLSNISDSIEFAREFVDIDDQQIENNNTEVKKKYKRKINEPVVGQKKRDLLRHLDKVEEETKNMLERQLKIIEDLAEETKLQNKVQNKQREKMLKIMESLRAKEKRKRKHSSSSDE